MMVVSATEDVQEDTAAGSEAAAPGADETGIPNSPHSHNVVEIGLESTQSSPSKSTSSSSFTDIDDVPLGQRYPKLTKSQPTSTKTNKKPKTNNSQEPVRTPIDDRIIGLAQRKAYLYNRFPVNYNPLRPPMIQPLNMVPSDENVEPSSSSQPPSTNQTEDTTVIDNLVSHYTGELPEVRPSLQRASEVASEEVASESPQQQPPNPQITTTISPAHEHVSASEHVSISESAVPEPTVPEQLAPEQTQSSTISLLVHVVNITRFDGVSITTDIDTDSEDDQVDPQSSHMDINIVPDQPSSSNLETTNDQPSSSNLAIVPVAKPKPRKISSPPTIFLDSTLLHDVCESIGHELIDLIQAKENLVHK
jgi:hypothetical protein